MKSYIVLARKWRPQTFADLLGQEHIAVTLRNAIAQNRVAHAFLFTGSRGVGKTSTARIFAKALNCSASIDGEPCNVCPSCVEITEGHAMDVIEIDGASNRGINEIRELLDGVRYAPSRDRYKIYIIDEVHMLTTEAFNALLKTLEEPPSHVIFIFATTDPNKIPVTILSRCQRYDYKRIGVDDLVGHLSRISKSEGIHFETSALRLIARTARGGVRDALSAMDQIIAFAEQPIDGEKAAEVLGVASRETLAAMVGALIHRDVGTALAAIEQVDRYGQNLAQFSFDLLEFLRDISVMAADKSGRARLELDATEQALVRAWLPELTHERLQRIFAICYEAAESLPKSLSPKILMEMAVMKMCAVEAVVPLDGVLRKLDATVRALGANVSMAPDSRAEVEAYLQASRLKMPATEAMQGLVTPSNIDSNEAVSREAASREAASREAASREAASREAASREAASREAASREAASREAASREAASREAASREANVREASPSEISSKASIPSEKPEEPDSMPHSIWDSEEGINAYLPDEGEAPCGVLLSDEEDEIDVVDEKTLEFFSQNQESASLYASFKPSASTMQSRWRAFVARFDDVLGALLSHAELKTFDETNLEICLTSELRELLKQAYVDALEQELAQAYGSECKLTIHVGQVDAQADTLVLQALRESLVRRDEALEAFKSHETFRRIIELFDIEPNRLRLDYHQKSENS